MASRPKYKMTREERAKQFMPFAALRGLEDALAAREHITVTRNELPPDAADELNRKMNELQPGNISTIIYYSHNEYIKITGMVTKIDVTSRIIQIVNTKIKFDDINGIE